MIGGLFLSLVPSIFHIDTNSKPTHSQGASGIAGVLWPICFMLGFVPSAIMNVLEEKVLKDREADVLEEAAKRSSKRGDREGDMVVSLLSNPVAEAPTRDYSHSVAGAGSKRLDIMYFLAWTSLFQWVTLAAFFFTDLIPGFGMAKNIGSVS